MAGGVNKVILIGNLGSDPEVRYLDGGSVVARFNIATSETYTNKGGEKIEQTEWHRIELWNALAKVAEKYLRKGNQVYVEGKIRTENWTDKEGQARTSISILANSMTMLGGSGSGGGYDGPGETSSPTTSQPAGMSGSGTPSPTNSTKAVDPIPPALASDGDDDDLPF
ncbi:single-stranded DNA-binding protein [Persicitalea jodogahamensis]|uniref:Single-stranded DNA-binding protein n=1 Tax=Persicitalea jodogahamensis TaxID=402147 RepID=A0A8J3D2A1_9BACT|nr:single-stranded DNA-binding protein [Persicitalea jodogahamensis]GHB57107.1 single-stranded DNA-binding protein [Persicitalea jodogahamensis]